VTDNQINQQLVELMGRLAKLPSANLEPPQFFANFLQLSVAVTGSEGGAVWITQQGQALQCYCHIDIELSGINESEEQKKLILGAIQRVVAEGRSEIIPPLDPSNGASSAQGSDNPQNSCPRPFFFKPLRAANQVAMVLQIIGSQAAHPQTYRAILGLLDQAGEYAETYLAHRRAAVLEDDRKALARLLKYDEAVYGSLDPEKVIYQIANLGREAVGSERLAVWIDPQVKRGLVAVSGVDKPDRRGILMQSLEKLSRHCLQLKKPVVASRPQLKELPEEEELTQLLMAYFNASQLNQIFLQPMEGKQGWIGVIAAEGFDEQTSTNVAGVLSTMARHGSVALENAIQASSASLIRPFSRLKSIQSDSKVKKKWISIVSGSVLVLLLVSLIPWTIRIDARCELVPRQLRMVDSPIDLVQIEKVEIPRGQVHADDVVMRLNHQELKAQLLSLKAEHKQVQVELDKAIRPADIKSLKYSLERLQSQMDFIQWQIDKCHVKSPIDGTILTDQLELREGITVKKGDPLFEVADLENWQLLLDVPQEEIGWVQRALQPDTIPPGGAKVQFFLAAYPEYKMETAVPDLQKISQTPRVKEEGNVYEIRLDVPSDQVEPIRSGLRSGSTGRAKIDTCRRPLAYVMLRKVIRFFRVTFF